MFSLLKCNITKILASPEKKSAIVSLKIFEEGSIVFHDDL